MKKYGIFSPVLSRLFIGLKILVSWKVRFFIAGGDGSELRRGGSLVNFLKLGRVKPVLFVIEGGSVFLARKKLLSVA